MLLLGPRPIITRTIGEPSTLARSSYFVPCFVLSLCLQGFLCLSPTVGVVFPIPLPSPFIDARFLPASPPLGPRFVRRTFVRDSFTVHPFNGCTLLVRRMYMGTLASPSRLNKICSQDIRIRLDADEGCDIAIGLKTTCWYKT